MGYPGVTLLATQKRISPAANVLRPKYFRLPQKLTAYSVVGITRNSAGTPIGSCTVHLFDTGTDTKLGTTISDATTGSYTILIPQNSGFFYCVAYKAGAPDVSGTTVNFVIGVDPATINIPTQVDLYTDMENSTDGTILTSTIAANGTHGTGGTWHTRKNTTDDGVLTQLFVSTAQEKQLRNKINVGSPPVSYDDVGSTRSWKMHCSVDIEYMKYVWTTTKPKVSMGIAMYFSSAGVGWGTTTNNFDVMSFHGAGEFAVLSLEDKGTGFGIPGDFILRLHTGLGTSAQQVYGNMDTWYWVTILWDRNDGTNGHAYMAIYNMATWTQMSGSPLDLAFTSANDADFPQVGRSDGHGNFLNADYYMDDLMMDWTKAVFPLTP